MTVSLLDLPPELWIEYICPFMGYEMIDTLSLVCKDFHNFTNNEYMWKMFMKKTFYEPSIKGLEQWRLNNKLTIKQAFKKYLYIHILLKNPHLDINKFYIKYNINGDVINLFDMLCKRILHLQYTKMEYPLYMQYDVIAMDAHFTYIDKILNKRSSEPIFIDYNDVIIPFKYAGNYFEYHGPIVPLDKSLGNDDEWWKHIIICENNSTLFYFNDKIFDDYLKKKFNDRCKCIKRFDKKIDNNSTTKDIMFNALLFYNICNLKRGFKIQQNHMRLPIDVEKNEL